METVFLVEAVQSLAQFGVAGLMGVLWIWERWLSRQREQQINEAHARLMRQQDELENLVRLVDRNARAFDRFSQTQDELRRLLENLYVELDHPHAA